MWSVTMATLAEGRTVTENPRKAFARAAIACTALLAQTGFAQNLPVERIKLPPGFEISVFASVPGARTLAVGPDHLVFVGTRGDKVYTVRYAGTRATEVVALASDLNAPNGVAVRNGALYVAEIGRILRYDDIEKQLAGAATARPRAAVVTDRYPSDNHHSLKLVRFGPDGWLYVPVGAPCNICEPDAAHGLISRIKPDGSDYEVFARGVRNSVGFDWDPRTKELWFTDNGRDWLGDELPSDELNHAPKKGMNFGFPYCHQGDVADPEFGRKRNCSEFTPPAVKLGPHVASLGMRFYTGAGFPAEYRDNIFVAEHGSWNRSKKIGYRVARVVVERGRVIKHETFAEGWLQGDSVWGRPVDVEVLPDGSLIVSDDYAGAIYRIAYRGG
jgi:glucose/arabinose dehydrogenase